MKTVFGSVVLSGIVAALIAFAVIGKGPIQPAKAESAYDRVMRTQTIRCGYFVWPPALAKDPKTGALSGVFYDYMQAMGKALDLKIEWTQELNFATYLDDLKAGRYDAECSGGWPNATRGKVADYTDPIFFAAVVPFARTDDHRFDTDQSRIDYPDIRVATVDGETSQFLYRQHFAKAKEVSLPQTASAAEMLLNVASGKADVTFTDLFTGYDYIQHNPGSLHRVGAETLKITPNNLTIAQNEPNLKNMLNVASRELRYDGTIEHILQTYEPMSGTFVRVAPDYK